MGIDIHSAEFLRSEVRRGLRFGRTLTLGHQALYMDRRQYESLSASLGISCRNTEYADDFFRGLSATDIDVMDASNYEGANLVHDLNEPVDPRWRSVYDLVFDGGALEHVFNFPLALKNCLEMVKVGGHFITITPANAHCGHGFYQFSPDLFYSALSPENGFLVERLLFRHRRQWYSVRNPAEIRERIELLTHEPTLFFVSARRCEQKPIFAKWPQQSDYVQAWTPKEAAAHPTGTTPSAKDVLLRVFPYGRKLQASWRTYKHRRRCSPSNRAWFTPVDLKSS